MGRAVPDRRHRLGSGRPVAGICAIDPDHRDRYVETAADLLKAGGFLLGVFYNIQPETGPPFGATREELLDRFEHHFTLILDRVPRSIPGREGKELLMLWQRKR